MSDSNRGKFDYVGLLTFLAIALPLYAAMIWDLSAQQTRYEVEATYAARDYAESTDAQIRDLCVEGPLQSRVQCAKEIIAANRENERSERDLEAQQTMARWTLVMGAVAGFGLLISLLGVVLVYITFRETRRAADAGFRANEIAQESSERQLRAYVGVSSASITPIEDGSGFVLQCELTNAGQTPAYNTRIMGESYAAEHPLTTQHPFAPVETGYGTAVNPGGTLNCAYRLFTDDIEQTIDDVIGGDMGLYLQGICEYEDAFGVRRQTTFRYVFGGRIAQARGLVLFAAETGNAAT